MKVIRIPATKTSPAIVFISWYNSKGESFGFFLEGSDLPTVEKQISSEFFGVFEEFSKEYGE